MKNNLNTELKKIQDDEGNAINFTELKDDLGIKEEKEEEEEEDSKPENHAAIMFKQLFCFASITYDKLPEDVKKGGSPDDDR